MAGTITHSYFAEDVYNNFNNEKKEKFKDYLNDFKLYAQGHDILYFCYCLNIKKGKDVRKNGNVFHKKNTKKYLMNIIKYIKDNNLENNYKIVSFLYGYICHYCLDKTIHPYVTYKGGIFNSNDPKTYKYNSRHAEIETYIDCYIMKKREKLDNRKIKFYKFCLKYHKIDKSLKNLITFAFNETYNVDNYGKYFKISIKKMKTLYRIMRYDPHKIKLNIYKFIDGITSDKTKKLYPISYAMELKNDNYFLNLNNKNWYHPRDNKEIHNESVINLYNSALVEALNIINAVDKVLYTDKNIKYLDKYILNISYTSGKDCNDKRKNKYFEY